MQRFVFAIFILITAVSCGDEFQDTPRYAKLPLPFKDTLLEVASLGVHRIAAAGCSCESGMPLNISGYSGYFTSPDYPTPGYPNNAGCEYHLYVQEATGGIMLDFLNFTLEVGYDYVGVFDGASTSSNLLAKYDGVITYPATLYSTSTNMYLTFHSDTTITDVGFYAVWTADTACRYTTALPRTSYGSFYSPYFPENYAANKYCSWSITVSSSEVLIFFFNFFEVGSIHPQSGQCQYAWFEIYLDGVQQELYCGEYLPAVAVYQNAVVLFVMHSEAQIDTSQMGFMATYQLDTLLPPTTTIPTTAYTGPSTTTPTPYTGTSTTTPSPTTTPYTGPSTTTPIPTTTAAPPPQISPDPFLTITLNGTLVSPITITEECAARYGEAFHNNFGITVQHVNSLVDNNTMCPNNWLHCYAGYVEYSVSGTTAAIKFYAYNLAPDYTVMSRMEDCSWDVQGYLQNPANWPQPIVPSVEGCPDVVLEPYKYDAIHQEWTCG